MSGLTEEQSKLYKKLEGAIERKEQIDQILQSASENDLRTVLTAAGTIEKFENKEKRTETLLALAIYYDNYEAVKAILCAAKGKNILEEVLTTANITWELRNGGKHTLTPLGWAISINSKGRIKVVLNAIEDKGILEKALTTANIHIKFSNGQERTLTPFALATFYNDPESTEAILVTAKKFNILKNVLISLEKDDHEKIQNILQNSSIIDEVSQVLDSILVKDEDVPQPQAEANTLNLEKVKALLQKGADINQKDKKGFTPLCVAARSGNFDIVQALLNKDANVDTQTNNGYTALHIATFNNNLEIVQALLEKEADVNIQSNDGYIALYDAAKNNRLEIVQALLDKGAGVNIQEANNGYTALHMAAANGHTKIVEALLKVKEIDVNAQSKSAETPLYLAAQNSRLEIVQALLEKKADVNIQTNNNDYTALHIAAVNGCTDILKSLLPKATYPLLEDTEGNTPIDLIKDESAKAELQKLIEDLKTQDTAKPSVTKPGNQNSNTVHRVEGSAIKTAIKAGLSCGGVIFIVGVCFAAGSQTPILAIVGTAAAAVSFGLIAGIFAYAVSKPSSKVEKTDARQGQDPLSQTV